MKTKFWRDPLVGLALRFAIIFGLLIIPWPGWNGLYGQYFREMGRMVFHSESGKYEVFFSPNPDESSETGLDTEMKWTNRDHGNEQGNALTKKSDFNTRAMGWIPTALTMALILSTPIPWKRRVLALLGGLILIHSFILFAVQCRIWSGSDDLSSFWKEVMDELDYTLVNQMGPSFAVPVLIWILVTFRRKDVMVKA